MKLIRLVVSDLHLGTGSRPGEHNVFEDFHHDDAFAELLAHYDAEAGPDGEIELIMNGDIFDLLKVKIGGVWPTEITDELATETLRKCLDGHPRWVHACKEFIAKDRRRIVFLPGNHDIGMWFPGPQELFKRVIAPGSGDRVRFITSSDTYYLPEGIQIRHGHQLEHIHRMDYDRMTRTRRDGTVILDLPWGALWILEVMNPAKAKRSYVDRIQPLTRFLAAALLFDTRYVLGFLYHSGLYWLRRRIFNLAAWRERLRWFPKALRQEIFALGGFDEAAVRALKKLRGVNTLIVGHSHGPRFRQLSDGKVLINTGTWMRMINLDIHHLGQDSGLTYCRIEYSEDGRPTVNLMRWLGARRPFEVIPYAD